MTIFAPKGLHFEAQDKRSAVLGCVVVSGRVVVLGRAAVPGCVVVPGGASPNNPNPNGVE